jgi:hypothetical protein
LAFGELNLIDGPKNVGKSTLIADIAARVSRGEAMPFSDERDKPRTIFWLGREEARGSVALPRFAAAHGDPKRLLLPPREDLYFPKDFHIVEEIVRKYRVKMLVVDPIMGFIGDLKTNPNLDSDVRRFLAPLLELTRALKLCTILLRHFKKERDTGGNRGLGSVAWSALPRVQHVVAQKIEGDGKRADLACVRTLGKRPASLSYCIVGDKVYLPDPDNPGHKEHYDTWKMEWIGTTKITADEVAGYGRRQRGRPAEQRNYVVDVIKNLLAPRPMEAKRLWRKVHDATGASVATYKRARTLSGATVKQHGRRGEARRLWSLPKQRSKTR